MGVFSWLPSFKLFDSITDTASPEPDVVALPKRSTSSIGNDSFVATPRVSPRATLTGLSASSTPLVKSSGVDLPVPRPQSPVHRQTASSDLLASQESGDTLGPLRQSSSRPKVRVSSENSGSVTAGAGAGAGSTGSATSLDPLTDVILQRAQAVGSASTGPMVGSGVGGANNGGSGFIAVLGSTAGTGNARESGTGAANQDNSAVPDGSSENESHIPHSHSINFGLHGHVIGTGNGTGGSGSGGAGTGTSAGQGFSRSVSMNTLASTVSSVANNGNIASSGGSANGGFFSLLRKSSGRPTTDDELDYGQAGRDEAWKADVVGYIPNTPVPPKYVHVRAHRKKNREFNRVFLAQELRPPYCDQDHDDASANTSTNNSVSGDIGSGGTNGSQSSRGCRTEKMSNGRRSTSKNAIWSAKFSNDGRFLAVAGEDRVVRVWEVISTPQDRDHDRGGREKSGSFTGSSAATFATYPDSSDSEDHQHTNSPFKSKGGFKRRHNTAAYAPVFKTKPVREFYGHTADVLDLSWSKNNFLLSSSMDKTVRLWHIDKQECLCSFSHSDFVTSIKFHPKDDRFFISGSLDCKVRLWSIPDKEIAYERDAPTYITATAFSPDGNTVIVGCFGGQCLFYETEKLRKKREIRVRSTRGRNSKGSKITGIEVFQVVPQKRYSSRYVQFDNDIKLLISTNDSRLRLYNLHDGSMEIKFKGHENEQTQISATFSDDGRHIITGSEDSRTYIWSIDENDLYERTGKKKERQEYEYFHSNKSMVTVAIFAPTLTRQILAASCDPIYDICDPPPVQLKASTPSYEANDSNETTTKEAPTATNDDSVPLSEHKYPPLRTSRKSLHRAGNIMVTADRNGIIKIFRQDCAYGPRRVLLEATQAQKKRYSGIALSPSHSWRESLSAYRSKTARSANGGSSITGSPRPLTVGYSDTSSAFERGRSRAGSLIQSRSSSRDDSYLIRPSANALSGLNSPRMRPVSPGSSSVHTLRSSNSRQKLTDLNTGTTNVHRNSTSTSTSTTHSEPHVETLAAPIPVSPPLPSHSPLSTETTPSKPPTDDPNSIVCENCGYGEFIAKFICSEMRLLCSRCSHVYTPH
ncbi:hypothetical protein AWJ20_473 [Sugiyamaella lignohabitans]|uniref:WD repeat-containing protein 44 n=1 Tax=Sugiyamaella lignohabitans TaxID=796027 RepID=A0A167CXF1_9ASCO|nr:uncharacterized protein AWJ20_473 [Sugiyamaella lignohabitans]ANB12224.1 hypothetical protein AWJ20_473 [Sugiyamaella lignohabitans]